MSIFVNRGKHVFSDPTVPTEGGPVPDAAMIVPPSDGEMINGAVVEDTSHEFIMSKSTKKTLTVLPLSERTEAPALQKRGRGWTIAESRLDTIHEMARAQKREPTAAQVLLGEKLTEANLGKFKLSRQQVIGSAIVDFACNPLKLAVSIDEGGDPSVTARRDKSLEAVGVKLLRFPAARVLAEPDAVVAEIVAAMKASYDERGRARRQHYQTRGAPQRHQG